MNDKKIVIWGAGRIGRGFVGDIFNAANYQITFVDQSSELVNALINNKKYRVVRAASKDDISAVDISNYAALHSSQISEIGEAIHSANIMAIAVYPQNFEEVASQLKAPLLDRFRKSVALLNILLCTNLVHAGPKFEALLVAGLSDEDRKIMEAKTGVVETLVIRICPDPPENVRKEFPLIVWTNGYASLPVNKSGFKGYLPDMDTFRYVADMRAEEQRKMYTYNMCHAVLSYHGHMAGHELLVDCLADEGIRKEATEALEEVSQALQKKHGFSKEAMDEWIKGVITQTNNPTVGDTVVRSANDPLRKLKREDRLIGPALLCLDNDIQPYSIIRAIGAAFHYKEGNDQASIKLQKLIREKGIRKTIIEVCGLADDENGLVQKILAEYQNSAVRIELMKKAREAYQLGFDYEKTYHGCGQCVIAAMTEVLDNFDKEVFESATGLSGGVGLINQNTCSAYTAGVMVFGMCYPRRRENFDGDRENKYTTFGLAQSLHQKFLDEYGSVCCGDIHTRKYGRAYDLSKKTERELFEDAGGHGQDGCTEVVGKAAKWALVLISEEQMKKPNQGN